jgi:trehalose/maltose hydrolase-like predicted phosphorylase
MADDLEPTADPGWVIQEQGFDPLRERGIESRFSVGNGFLGVRGVPPIRCDQAWASRPRTFIAGLFDAPNILPAVPALVSGPDWVGVTILVDGEPLPHGPSDVAGHRRGAVRLTLTSLHLRATEGLMERGFDEADLVQAA